MQKSAIFPHFHAHSGGIIYDVIRIRIRIHDVYYTYCSCSKCVIITNSQSARLLIHQQRPNFEMGHFLPCARMIAYLNCDLLKVYYVKGNFLDGLRGKVMHINHR